jgi:hypothetical protein
MTGSRRQRAQFRPNFMLVLLYLVAGTIAFALAFALPELIGGARELGPASSALNDAELARARDIARDAVRGRLWIAFVAAAIAVGAGVWARVLPGLRR